MTAIALHVGLNSVDPEHYDGWDGALAGCENDARDLAALTRAQGYEATTLLTHEARAERVLAFLARGAELRAGDHLVLTFSGHGGQIDATDPGETDGRDETWVLYDRMIIDNEIRAALHALPRGVIATVVLDCCHSGTAIKAALAAHTTLAARGRNTPRVRAMPPQVARAVARRHQALYLDASRRIARGTTGSAALLAACRDDQLAADGDRNGLFTGTLKQVWRDGAFAGDHRAFIAAIRAEMPADQTPMLDHVGPDATTVIRSRPFTPTTSHQGTTMSNDDLNGNWHDVAAELDKRLGGARGADGWMTRAIAANARVAQQQFFGLGSAPVAADSRSARRGGTVARAFWWGFHIEISHDDLQVFLASANPVNDLIGAIGGGIPSPAAPFIAIAAAFVAGALGLLQSLDRGRGVYVSMSWFAPGIFIPTSV